MQNYVFKIFFDGKGEEFACQDEDLVTEPLEKFSKEKGKKLEDFVFYYKGSLVKYEASIHLKDSVFSQNAGKISNILAMLIAPTKQEKQEKEEREEKNSEEEESQPETKRNVISLYEDDEEKDKEEIEGNKIEEEKKEEEKKETKIVREKKINREYYNDIICPKCLTTAIIDREESSLSYNILNCQNFHYLKNICYDAFDEFVFDFDDESKENKEILEKHKNILKCEICSNHQSKLTPPNDIMYMCSCGSIVCYECIKGEEATHNEKGHFQIDLKDLNYKCILHNGERFSCYCMDCNTNLCDKCLNSHNGSPPTASHEIIKFSDIRPKKEDMKNFEKIADDQKEALLDFIEATRALFYKIVNTIDNYLNSYIMMEKTLIRRYKSGYWNYQLLRNLRNKNLFEKEMNIFKDLKKYQYDGESELDEKFQGIYNDIYLRINNDSIYRNKKTGDIQLNKKNSTSNKQQQQQKNNTITIQYSIGEKKLDRRVKLFDPIFVENNRDKFDMVIKGQRYDKETEKWVNFTTKKEKIRDIYRNVNDSKELIVTLKVKDMATITDLSYMFNNCKYLDEVKSFDVDTSNITSLEAMFQLCDIQKFLDFSKFDTSNLQNLRAMFCKCTKIEALPELSKWFGKENNITNMSMMFNGCKGLKNVNFFAKNAYTNKVEDISYMFNRCQNLEEIHSFKFNTQGAKNMCGFFNGCKKLRQSGLQFYLNNVVDMSIMFQNCVSLNSISFKNDAKNLNDISGIFAGCINLPLKSIGITGAEKIKKMVGAFRKCSKLDTIPPELGKWKLNEVEKAKGLFEGCKFNLRDKKMNYQLKFSKEIKFEDVFKGCLMNEQDREIVKRAWSISN